MNEKNRKYFETVIERCDERIRNCEAGRDRFAERCRENFHHAMQWADSQYELAGEWKAAHVIKALAEAYMEKGREPKELRAEVRNMVVQDAKYVKSSSSMSSNRQETETTAAYAKALDSFDGLLSR
jgi:hypothetical protein